MGTVTVGYLNNPDGAGPTYHAASMRQLAMILSQPYQSALGVSEGMRPGASGTFQVTVVDREIRVSGGSALVSGPAGPYLVVHSGTTTLDDELVPPDGSNPRMDLVFLRVFDDDEDGSGLRTGDLAYMPGTPSASPQPPTPSEPSAFLRVATILVPKEGGGGPVASPWPSYATALGGIKPDPGGLTRVGPYIGAYKDDGTTLVRWNGSAWNSIVPEPPKPERHYVQVVKDESYRVPTSWTAVRFDRKTAWEPSDPPMWEWGPDITVPVSGLYQISASMVWSASPRGVKWMKIEAGSTSWTRYHDDTNVPPGTPGVGLDTSRDVAMARGSRVRLSVQASNDIPSNDGQVQLSVSWIGP